MSTQTVKQYNHPAAWSAAELQAKSDEWIYTLDADDVAELDAALRGLKSKHLVVPNFGMAEFPMPSLAAKLRPYIDALDFGVGILQIAGWPIERYSKDEASAIFWGIGSCIGAPWEQNAAGHVLGDIIDMGKALDDTDARGYQTSADLDLHTDGADIVGLLCLKTAREGGENQFASAIAVLNKLMEIDPEAAQHLIDTTFCLDWRGEEGPGEKPYYRAKLFTETPKGMTSLALVPYIHSAQRFDEVPRLTDKDIAALEAYDRVKWDESLLLRLYQQPGGMLFLNNHYHLHARSQYVDHDDPAEKRHLRRLWLESKAWGEARPAAMATILDKVRTHWQTGAGVTMWDEEAA